MKVLITGATGLLGRAVLKAFQQAGWDAVGTGWSRATGDILRVDLRDAAALAAVIKEQQPNVIVHAAAERKPDVCEKDPTVEELNVVASWNIARLALENKSHLIYISTDYMFDGTAAPYKETAEPKPLNTYGHLKLRGEWAVLAAHPRPVILRVPLLYGPTDDLQESACTAFATVAKLSSKPASVDDWQIRVPTYTPDIAATLVNMSSALVAGEPRVGMMPGGQAQTELGVKGRALKGIYHYTSHDRYTRYELVRIFARAQGLDPDRDLGHVTKIDGMPPGAARPYDCHLDDSKLRATGLAAANTPFEVGVREVLAACPVKL